MTLTANQISARIDSWVRPHIRSLKPYASARDEFQGTAHVFLDANENPLGSATEKQVNRYPDPLQRAVKAQLAPIKGVRPEQIFLGNGSDEPIDLLFRCFCEPGKDVVMLVPPTYGMYQVSADINQVETIQVPLTLDYQLDLESMQDAMQAHVKGIFLCSPNNPTGNALSKEDMIEVLEMAPGWVVVDEAYIDFDPDNTMLGLLDDYPNLIVLQTFSKAWGMAGLRLGMAFAHPEIVQVLNKVKPPYNINAVTQEMALEALSQVDKKDEMVRQIIEERDRMALELSEWNAVDDIFPSQANFLLIKVPDAAKRYQELIEQSVVVRNRSKVLLCDNCLRITIGTKAENRQFLQTFAQILETPHNV
ncbi:histidinol-phosphate transaminase [Pontibacter sp. G13]|uniref:histidinol-phosphate transaminase n=1 Tax=Pontibacter sp. G13 TaxID=3074898 RepID=UPI00288B40CA|nr:histidinol-phosphate transaminase [Pontibacter sp. G13]WNJ18724.1 histidinol-phosphate transaminase [Pontibacter sp. G13]